MPAEKDRSGPPPITGERAAELVTNHKAALTVADWSLRTHQPAVALLEVLEVLGLDGET